MPICGHDGPPTETRVKAMRADVDDAAVGVDEKRLVFPALATLYKPFAPYSYAFMRFCTGAILVPQRAVTELQGGYQVAVVGAGNKVEIRMVKAAERVGSWWLIDEGLKAKERVVVEGVQKVKSGTVVNPQPYKAGAR